MLASIQGVLQHLGINKYGNRCTLTANAAGDVYSVQPNGTLTTQPPGTHGDYELGVLDGQLWSVKPISTAVPVYTFVVANIVGL